MPIFAAQNPPRVENTEARPPLKRWAYFLKDKSKQDMDKQKVIVYVDGFNFYGSMFTSVIRIERYESRFRNSLLPDTVRLKDGYELTIPEKWKAYQIL